MPDPFTISDNELQFSAIKASGPGGQHVNTTNSAIQLRFNAKECMSLSLPQYNRLKKIAGRRMTSEGIIILEVSDHRSQHRNKEIAKERLLALIQKCLKPPRARKKTRPTKASKMRRLEGKSKRATLKKTRGRVKNEG